MTIQSGRISQRELKGSQNITAWQASIQALNYQACQGPADRNRCGRRRRWHVPYVQHVLSLYKLKVIHQVTIRTQSLCAHTRAIRDQIVRRQLRHQPLQCIHEKLFAE